MLAFVAYCVAQGFRHRAIAGQSLEQYFLAGRSLPGWKAGISMAATQFAADTPLVVTGLIASAGIFGLWRLWIYAPAFLLLGFVLGPSWRKAGVLTDAELSEARYGGRAAAVLRVVKAVYFGTVWNCVVLAMVLLGATRIAEPFLTWNTWLPAAWFDPLLHVVKAVGVPLTIVAGDPAQWPADVWTRSANNLLSIAVLVAVTAFYSMTGGLRSVVATDLVQFAIMMAGTFAYAWCLLAHVGGWNALPEHLVALFARGSAGPLSSADHLLSFTPSHEIPLAFLTVLALQWLAQMNSDGTGYLAQRTMACRSDRDAKQAALCFTVAQILFRSLLWLPIGVGLLVLFPPQNSPATEAVYVAEREFTYVLGMREVLPAGIKGLVLTAMLAALASTVDTHLNWGASYWSNDLYKRGICQGWLGKEPSPRSLVQVARLSNGILLLLALGVMIHLGSIQEAWLRSLLLGAGMGGLLVLRWLWWRWNAWGELCGLLGSVLLVALSEIARLDSATAFLLVFVGATLSGVAGTLLSAPEEQWRLVAFYRRARPPGFWAPVACAAGCPDDGVRRLAVGLAAVAVASFSLFSVLVSVGSWVVGSPAPSWWPGSRTQWLLALFGAGVLLVPLWWRLAFPAADKEE